MPKWKKPPEALVRQFESAAASFPALEKRKMFGYPAVFANGNMVSGLHEDRFILRLPEKDREEFLRLPGAEVFEPMPGRPMREYVVAPGAIVGSPRHLSAWLNRSIRYACTLPPKSKKPKAPAKKPGK